MFSLKYSAVRGLLCAIAVLLAFGSAVQAPPVSILVSSDDSHEIDPAYEQQLLKAGYRVKKVTFAKQLTPEYLRQFGAVILTRLPYAGEKYSVGGGQRLAFIERYLERLREYMAAGGGVIIKPAINEFGEAYVESYNDFLKPYGLQLIAQQLWDDANARDSFAVGAKPRQSRAHSQEKVPFVGTFDNCRDCSYDLHFTTPLTKAARLGVSMPASDWGTGKSY